MGPWPPSNLEERKGLKEAQHAAHSHPSRTRGAISASLEGSHRDPRLRPASPPRSRVANLPSSRHLISASLEATPRHKGQTAPPLNRSPYGGIKGQPLLHGSQDGRRRAAIPTVDVTGVSSADFSLCSVIPDAVAALWDLRRRIRRARHCSRYYSADTDQPDPPLAGEEGPATSRIL